MNPTFLHEIEIFFTTGPGVFLLRTLAILSALGALGVLLRRKPRGEWKRAAAVAIVLVLFHALVLLTDLSTLGSSAGIIKSFTANVGRSSSFLLALAAIWFFLAPRRNPTGDTLAIILAFIGLLAAVLSSGSFFLFGGNIPYNGNWISLLWDGARGVMLAAAIILLIVRRPPYWGVSLAALALLLSGVLAQASLSDATTYLPGLAGLFDVMAAPFIAMRLALAASGTIAAAGPITAGTPARQARLVSTEAIPLLADLLLTSEEDMPQALATWLAGAMHVEVCLLVTRADEENNLLFFAGFDRVHMRELPVFTIPSERSSQLYFSVTGREPLRIERKDIEVMLRAVSAGAGLEQPGPALYAPLTTPSDIPMGILLMAAYSQEEWDDGDAEALARYVQAGTAAFQRTHAISLLRQDLENAIREHARAATEVEKLQSEQMNLEMRLQQAEQEWQKERQRAESLATLVQGQDATRTPGDESGRVAALEHRAEEAASHEEEAVALLRRELDRTRADLATARVDADRLPDAVQAAAAFREESLRLQSELQRVKAQLESQPGQKGADAVTEELLRLHAVLEETEQRAYAEIDRLQAELRRTLAEYGHLQSALLQPPPASAEQQKGAAAEIGPESGMVTSLISEIRQPLSSMVGYADLLLSESAGILGAMQRKFLERIRASTTRTEALFDDLLQLILLPGKVSAPRIQPVDVPSLIDTAVSSVSDTVREKGLILRLDLDEEMPPVEMDRDALQQIINHLVQNAVLATPSEKEVFLTAHAPLSDKAARRALLLTVKDGGPGISAEDQPRVFTRLYRTEGPIIEGLGDTGVGLAVARTLTEALGGRIWLESQPGQGVTIFVLLPAQAAPPQRN
jgi:signal transduction histidine kinase